MESTKGAPKPKRFSQRQRHSADPAAGTPNLGPNQIGPQVGASHSKAVPVSGNYSQPPGYYEQGKVLESYFFVFVFFFGNYRYFDFCTVPLPSTYDAQVYETGTVNSVPGSGSSHGPSVSQSIWVPHSSPYVTAQSYPSPSTGIDAGMMGRIPAGPEGKAKLLN